MIAGRPFLAASKARTLIFAAMFALLLGRHAQAQAIFSFESPDLDGWSTTNTNGVSVSQTTLGATDGTMALSINDIPTDFQNNIARTGNFGPSTVGFQDAYNAFALAGSVMAAGGHPVLEFDLTSDFSNVTVPDWLQLAINISSNDGWKQYGTGAFLNGYIDGVGGDPWPYVSTFQNAVADGVTITPVSGNTVHVSVPMGLDKTLWVAENSTYYYLGFQSKGGYTGTVNFSMDNIFFSGVPQFEEHTLFSWETPDDPNTAINEQLEGWETDPNKQILSISSTGATDGLSAMQLDRTPLPSGFTWGSAFGLESDPNGAGVDPTVQAEIDDFITRINGASQVAVDITYEDQFPINPSYSQIYLAFTDETGVWYQEGSAGFEINNADPGTTQTLTFDIEEFFDNGDPNGLSLAGDGLLEGSNAFGIVMGTSTDGGAIYQLDNLRLISEVFVESADFNGDGVVDGKDFMAWQIGSGIASGATPAQGDANNDGAVNGLDLDIWEVQYGTNPLQAAVAAVPEPSTALLTLLVAMATLTGRRGNLLGRMHVS